jgi:hypothetical protein
MYSPKEDGGQKRSDGTGLRSRAKSMSELHGVQILPKNRAHDALSRPPRDARPSQGLQRRNTERAKENAKARLVLRRTFQENFARIEALQVHARLN